MRLGIILPLFSGDPGKVTSAAREAESLGYHGVFAFDHFFPPGASPDRPSLEAFATLGTVAAVTERVRVGTLVARASIRPVGLLAKTAAWLDHASGGRFILGIGTGDPIDRGEHQAYGLRELDKKERRLHLEEAVTALKALFAGGRYEGGDLVPALEGPVRPPPARPDGPPVWIGGQADEVAGIAARVADGWNGWGFDPAAFRDKVRILHQAAGDRPVEASWAGIVLAGEDRREARALAERRQAQGLDDASWTGPADELAEFLGELSEAGAAWAALVLAGPADRRRLVAERVLSALPAG